MKSFIAFSFLFLSHFLVAENKIIGPSSCYSFKIKVEMADNKKFVAYFIYNQNKSKFSFQNEKLKSHEIIKLLNEAAISQKTKLFKKIYLPRTRKNQLVNFFNNSEPTHINQVEKFAFVGTSEVLEINVRNIKKCEVLEVLENQPYNILESTIEIIPDSIAYIYQKNQIKSIVGVHTPTQALTQNYFFSTTLTIRDLKKLIQKYPIFYKDLDENVKNKEKIFQQKLSIAKKELLSKGVLVFELNIWE